MLNFKKSSKQQKSLSNEAQNLATSVYCMSIADQIMAYLDHKIEDYNDLPDYVKSACGA
jgi:hypothetical protein